MSLDYNPEFPEKTDFSYADIRTVCAVGTKIVELIEIEQREFAPQARNLTPGLRAALRILADYENQNPSYCPNPPMVGG